MAAWPLSLELEEALAPNAASESSQPLSPEERAAWARSIRGSLRDMPFSSEDLIREKQEEIDRKEERWERRFRKTPPEERNG